MIAVRYRRDIDGLRAVAVVPVVLFHFGVRGFSGGYVGVDVFFVISGFLITSLLAREIDAARAGTGPAFSIARFYDRRIRRIFPALFATLTFVAGVSVWLLLPGDLKDTAKALVAATLFGSNFLFAREAGYFDAPAHSKPLLHTWSLAVEEQFYVFFPLALWLVSRLLPKRRTLVFALVAATSLGVAEWTSRHAAGAFYLTQGRVWELLFGSILALHGTIAWPRAARDALSLAGLAAILFAVFAFSEATRFPSVYALAPVVGSTLVIASGTDGASLGGRVLSWSPFVFLGQISYSLYLWHWPLVVFARYYLVRELAPLETVALAVVTLAVSWASWRFVEQPFRKLERPPRKIIAAGLGAAVVFAALGVAGYQLHLPSRLGDEAPSALPSESYRHRVCFLDNDQTFAEWDRAACTFPSREKGAPKVVLWGDSYAAHYSDGLIALQGSLAFDLVQINSEHCAPFSNFDESGFPNCKPFNAAVLDLIARDPPKVVVIAARWNRLRDQGLVREKMTESLRLVRASGARVLLVGESPYYAANVPQIRALLERRGVASDTYPPENAFEMDAVLRSVADQEGAAFFAPRDALCDGARCKIVERGELMHLDQGHLSKAGSVFVTSKMSGPLEELLE